MTAIVQRLGHLDHRLLVALVVRRRPRLDRWMRAFTYLGDPIVMLATGAVLLFGATMLPVPADVARDAALGILLSFLFGQLVKRKVSRRRPVLPVGLRSLIEAPDHFSFPSGHAAAGLSVAIPFAVWQAVPWAVPVVALGLVVGISRAYLGVHYPGDIVAGWGLAGLAAALLALLG